MKSRQVISPQVISIHFTEAIDPDATLTRRLAPSLTYTSDFQLSVHTPGTSLTKELELVFPSVQNISFVIPTFQKSRFDLIAVSPETQWERNLLWAYFNEFATRFIKLIQDQGYWADGTDPCDGFPLHSQRGSCLYPDVDANARLLNYDTEHIGCCRVLVHPIWRTHNYPATLFTNAPLEVLESIFSNANNSFHDNVK